MVSAGSLVTYQAKATSTFWSSPNDILAAVKADITAQGLNVEDVQGTTGNIIGETMDAITGSGFPFSVTMTVQTVGAFNQPSDIQGIIDHAFYTETGQLPVASSVPLVQDPNATAAKPTGAATQQQASGGSGGTDPLGLGSFFNSVTSGTGLGLGLVALGIIAALVLMNQPGRARA